MPPRPWTAVNRTRQAIVWAPAPTLFATPQNRRRGGRWMQIGSLSQNEYGGHFNTQLLHKCIMNVLLYSFCSKSLTLRG